MGLLRGVARTAVVAGTATAVSNRVSRRQAGRWAAQEQQAAPPPEDYPPQQQYAPPPPPPAPAAPDPDADLARLKQLGELPRRGRADGAGVPGAEGATAGHVGGHARPLSAATRRLGPTEMAGGSRHVSQPDGDEWSDLVGTRLDDPAGRLGHPVPGARKVTERLGDDETRLVPSVRSTSSSGYSSRNCVTSVEWKSVRL